MEEEIKQNNECEYEQPLQEEYAQENAETEINGETPNKEAELMMLAQRIQADFDNFRKRNASAVSAAREEGKNETAALFLPVMDTVERALQAEQPENTLYQGLTLLKKQLEDILSRLGVEEIPALCQPFDPTLHHAVMQSPAAENEEKGVVSEVFEKGYRAISGGRVLRYAMVKVTC